MRKKESMTRKVFRFLGHLFTLLGGIVLYAALAVIEAGDMMAFLPKLSDPTGIMADLGLTREEAMLRIGILFVLALGIVFFSLASIYGIVFGSSWVRWTGGLAGGLFVVFGLFQVGSAFLVIHRNQTGIAMAGLAYAMIGLAVLGLTPRKRTPAKPSAIKQAR
jgi:hypothetical protein